jgi:rRNA maturation endonuclease Nob1
MKECINCKKVVRDSDKYCRNCGIRVLKPYQNILINITKVLSNNSNNRHNKFYYYDFNKWQRYV